MDELNSKIEKLSAVETTAKKPATVNTPCALVTGANRGIGYGIVRGLSHVWKGTIYLTARDETRGQEAVHALARDDGLSEFLLLDVTDRTTIERARDHILRTNGGLDILVNNAGIAGFDGHTVNGPRNFSLERTLNSTELDALRDQYSPEIVRQVVETNFFGVLNVCEIMFPLLRPHARVVNLSNGLGTLRNLKLEDVKARLVSDDLTVDELKQIMSNYVKVAETQNPAELGYPETLGPYSFSKMCVIALSRIQQRMFDQDPRKDIIVNAVTPGFVATEMTAYKGTRTIDEGTASPLYCALLPKSVDGKIDEDIPRGQFVRDRMPVDWVGEKDRF